MYDPDRHRQTVADILAQFEDLHEQRLGLQVIRDWLFRADAVATADARAELRSAALNMIEAAHALERAITKLPKPLPVSEQLLRGGGND